MLLPLTPFITFLFLYQWNEARLAANRTLILGFCSLALVSFLLQGASVYLLYARKSQSKELIRSLQSKPALPILTDLPQLAEDLAPLYFRQPMFLMRDMANRANLETKLIENEYSSYMYVTQKDKLEKPSEILCSEKHFRMFQMEMKIIDVERAR